MIKIRATVGDRPTIIIGLSHANLDRLRQDDLRGAIVINGAELGITADIWITAATTEGAMMEAFGDLVGPETKVRIDPRLKS
jgi:hypothetical protein